MSKPTGYCPNCKKEVEFLVERGSMFCPDCWNKVKQPEIGAKKENPDGKSEFLEGLIKCFRLMFIVALVLAGVALVLLAFLYAACSNMGKI